MTKTRNPAARSQKSALEYALWGKERGETEEKLLVARRITKADGSQPVTDLAWLESIAKQLAEEYGCHDLRIQTIDPAQCPSELFKAGLA